MRKSPRIRALTVGMNKFVCGVEIPNNGGPAMNRAEQSGVEDDGIELDGS